MPQRSHTHSGRAGVLYGVAAFGFWGLVPIYFKAIKTVPALQVVSHRIVWSAVLFAIILLVQRRGRDALQAIRSRRNLAMLTASTVLVASNWLIFIWAVAHNHVLQASLGYFINPLVNVLLGRVFLHERLRRLQWISVGISAAGVTYLTVSYGQFPLIALMLAMTFGLYGLVRKVVHVDSIVGLAIETTLLAPLATVYLVGAGISGTSAFLAGSARTDLLLVLAGVITAVPLIWFVNAARLLRLSTVGFLQYIGPTGQFVLAVFAFGEPFTHSHLVSFGLVWTGLAIYAVDTARWTMRESTAVPTVADNAAEM